MAGGAGRRRALAKAIYALNYYQLGIVRNSINVFKEQALSSIVTPTVVLIYGLGTQTMRHVVLPQALKNMIPSLVTQFIVLFKDTSLASIIGFMDLTKAAQVVNAREVRPFALYLFIAVVYWFCTYSMSRYARYVEGRLTPA